MNMLSSVNARSHCKIKQSSLACYATPAVNLSVPILLYRALQYPHHWSVNDDVCDWCSTNAEWKPTPWKQRGSCCLTNNICFAKDKRHFNSWTNADSYLKHDTDRIQAPKSDLTVKCRFDPSLVTQRKMMTQMTNPTPHECKVALVFL